MSCSILRKDSSYALKEKWDVASLSSWITPASNVDSFSIIEDLCSSIDSPYLSSFLFNDSMRSIWSFSVSSILEFLSVINLKLYSNVAFLESAV